MVSFMQLVTVQRVGTELYKQAKLAFLTFLTLKLHVSCVLSCLWWPFKRGTVKLTIGFRDYKTSVFISKTLQRPSHLRSTIVFHFGHILSYVHIQLRLSFFIFHILGIVQPGSLLLDRERSCAKKSCFC